eukprot:jgi/Chrzof1/8307/Cz03g05190.t1
MVTSSKPNRPEDMATSATKPPVKIARESTWQHDADLQKEAAAYSTKGVSGKALVLLAFSALGVIYGDIGTSPLYSYQTVFTMTEASHDQVLGSASLFFWTLTLIVLVKYVGVVLRADDNGEGGTFALYSLLCRAIGIGPFGQSLSIDYSTMESYSSNMYDDSAPPPRWCCSIHSRVGIALRNYYRRSKVHQVALLVVVVLATAMVVGDGVLTPSISVLSAVSGLTLATNISNSTVVGITIAILVVLFGLQPLGTAKISAVFAPIVLTWFISNAAIGFYNLSLHGWGTFAVLSPHYAVLVFVRDFKTAWHMLGGVTLCITGAEAMYADLGHFSVKAVRVRWCDVLLPCPC